MSSIVDFLFPLWIFLWTKNSYHDGEPRRAEFWVDNNAHHEPDFEPLTLEKFGLLVYLVGIWTGAYAFRSPLDRDQGSPNDLGLYPAYWTLMHPQDNGSDLFI